MVNVTTQEWRRLFGSELPLSSSVTWPKHFLSAAWLAFYSVKIVSLMMIVRLVCV